MARSSLRRPLGRASAIKGEDRSPQHGAFFEAAKLVLTGDLDSNSPGSCAIVRSGQSPPKGIRALRGCRMRARRSSG
jgi:hypothetical protein